jgi:hypothetical protein
MAVSIGEEPGGDPATGLGRIRVRRFVVKAALGAIGRH